MGVRPIDRLRIFERDGYRCRLCAAVDRLTIDHIVPLSGGGGDEIGNLQTLCAPCNIRKGGVRRTRPGGPLSIQIDIRITPQASDTLDALAEAEQRTRSDMARILLDEALRRRAGG